MKENKVRTQKTGGVMGYSVARLTGSDWREWKAVAHGNCWKCCGTMLTNKKKEIVCTVGDRPGQRHDTRHTWKKQCGRHSAPYLNLLVVFHETWNPMAVRACCTGEKNLDEFRGAGENRFEDPKFEIFNFHPAALLTHLTYTTRASLFTWFNIH